MKLDFKIEDMQWLTEIKALSYEQLRAGHYIDPCFRCNKPDAPYRSYKYPTLEGNFCEPCWQKLLTESKIG